MPTGHCKPQPVAMIPYVNMLPYRMLGTPGGCCWHEYVPRESVGALANGRVVAAAIPVGALPALDEWVEPLGQYGIAARQKSMSVLLFSKQPFDRIRPTDRLRITPDSATSVRLLQILLNRWAPYAGCDSPTRGNGYVGELVIGDRALAAMQARRHAGASRSEPSLGPVQFPHVTDLATRWFQRFRHAFVFARWVIRRDAPRGLRDRLLEWLNRFQDQEDELVARAIPVAARRLGLPESCLADYYQCLRRVLDVEDLAGQAYFLDALTGHAPASDNRPLVLAARAPQVNRHPHPKDLRSRAQAAGRSPGGDALKRPPGPTRRKAS